MRCDSHKPRRKSLRLQDYDYAQPGAYFVTTVTRDRLSLFGEIVDNSMRLNHAGRMVARWWTELANKFPTVEIDEYVVMPDHFHGIVAIIEDSGVGADLRVGPHDIESGGEHTGSPRRISLPRIMQWFKTMTTNEYIRGVKQLSWPPFRGKLWQRDYYERVIRSDAELNHIRRYIIDNPKQWALDSEQGRRQRP